MLTTASTPRRRLLLQATAVLALLLLVGITVLMHSMLGHASSHDHAMTAPVTAAAEQHHGAASDAEHAVAPAGPMMTVLSDAGCDGGLCALMCSLMGMACALTIALFAWVLLRARSGGILYVLARLLALADPVARRVAVPRPPSLSALQIIRI
ncbi:hypothetical protein [Curtobacterium sp. MCSS17_015]|uniref:hypothetical protein n=1 Tax=Curtobacterium sp. MCSS17_015 TaxID=2175666 RepID=UPI000DAAC773|nr:hypothetical protein [Curtobacterium sp. MCSS17_015]WIB25706.1 hypothetical protein DEJ18_11685 [Curtobacterium sp. MCSS17_015]